MEGSSHAVRSSDGAGILPNNDPGNNGGGALMSSTSTPSTADFEDLFGPAGREVQQDNQRHKRHQRWHLPDVLKETQRVLKEEEGIDLQAPVFESIDVPIQFTVHV